jgi:serine/threonine-protein kinase
MPALDPLPLPDLPRQADGLSGATVGGVMLNRLVSEDSAGRTYQGRQVVSGRVVQVRIAAEHLAMDPSFAERFRREADQLVGIRHVHVECCLEHWSLRMPTGAPLLGLVSEESAGVSLAELLVHERPPARDLLRLGQQICEGLAAAHHRGLVHGNLTPQAVLVSAGGFAKVCGFALGVSGYAAEHVAHSLTGAPEFMAPEVCRGQQPSAWSDLYSLGALLFTSLAGEVPFPAQTPLEAIHLHLSAAVPDLADRCPEFAAVAPLVGRLLAKDAATRGIDAEAVARDLLVAADLLAGGVRCRAPREDRPRPLTSMVRAALSHGSASTRQAVPAAPEAAPPQRPSPGTSSISRDSTDYFRNPERFKPAGVTPAGGSPTIPAATNVPTTRVLRRIAATAPVSIDPPAPAPAPPPAPAPVPVTATRIATATVPRPVPPSRALPRWLLPALALVLVVGIGVALAVRGGRSAPPPAPPVAKPVAPVGKPLLPLMRSDRQVAAVRAMLASDPATALEQAAQLRADHPHETFATLPLPARLLVEGPGPRGVRVKDGNAALVLGAGGELGRFADRELRLLVSGPGYRSQEVVFPADASTAEQVRTVTLLDEPAWSHPPFGPSWVRAMALPGGVLIASDRKVVLLDADDGRELARLDHAVLADLPAEGLGWASAVWTSGNRLRLATSGGLCLETEVGASFAAPTVLHRAQGGVLAFAFAAMPLRLGEQGFFAIERVQEGTALVADSPERRLWRVPLTGTLAPWMGIAGDQVVVLDEQGFRRVSQEGEVGPLVPLPARRTGAPLAIGQQLLVPTLAGTVLVSALAPLAPRMIAPTSHPVGALAGDGELVALAAGRQLQALRLGDAGAETLWRRDDLGRRVITHLGSSPDGLLAADEGGTVHLLRWADGRVLRTLRCGGPLLTAPVSSAGRLVVVQAPGIVHGFASGGGKHGH